MGVNIATPTPLYTAHSPAVSVRVTCVLLKLPIPAPVVAATLTRYSVYGDRPVNTRDVLLTAASYIWTLYNHMTYLVSVVMLILSLLYMMV